VLLQLLPTADASRRARAHLTLGDHEIVCRGSDTGGRCDIDGPAWPTDGPDADPRLTLADLLSSGWGVDPERPGTVWFSMWRTRRDGPA
jgi:hypothetical protein